MINDSPLEYWRHNGYSREDIDAVCKELDQRLAARVVFNVDRSITITISKRVAENREGHAPSVAKFFEDVARKAAKPLEGSVIAWLHDGYMLNCGDYLKRAPILTFGRDIKDHYSFLIPDPAFLETNGYVADRAEIDELEKTLTWEKKKPTVFWRGASSGSQTEGKRWLKAPRIRLPIISKELNKPEILDARLSKIVKYNREEQIKRIEDLDILDHYCPFSDFVQYRYQVDLDGYHCAWMSLFKKLYMNSVVMKTDSPFIQWYYDRLIPWKHYVPLQRDLEDLMQKIEWLHAHDQQCQQIAAQATELIKSLSDEEEVLQTAKLLAELFSCGKGGK